MHVTSRMSFCPEELDRQTLDPDSGGITPGHCGRSLPSRGKKGAGVRQRSSARSPAPCICRPYTELSMESAKHQSGPCPSVKNKKPLQAA